MWEALQPLPVQRHYGWTCAGDVRHGRSPASAAAGARRKNPRQRLRSGAHLPASVLFSAGNAAARGHVSHVRAGQVLEMAVENAEAWGRSMHFLTQSSGILAVHAMENEQEDDAIFSVQSVDDKLVFDQPGSEAGNYFSSGGDQPTAGVVELAEPSQGLKLDYDDLIGGSVDGLKAGDASDSPLEAANDAISGAQDAVANFLANLQNNFEQAVAGFKKAGDDSLRNAGDGGVSTSLQGGFNVNLENPIPGLVDTVQGFFQEVFTDAEQAVQNVSDGVTGSFQNAVNSVTGAIDSVRLDIQTSIDSTKAATQQKALDTFGIFYPGTPANDVLRVAVDGVKSNLGAAFVTVEGYGVRVYGSVKGNLPEDIRDVVNSAEGTISEYSRPVVSGLERGFDFSLQLAKAVGVDVDNPIVPTLAVVITLFYFGLSSWIERYGGYSGDLDPRTAFEILGKERNVALVDIRPQEVRDRDGILDLRRGARFKDSNIDMIQVRPAVKKLVKNSRDIDNVVTAVVIRNLRNVKSNSKVILLDTDGRQSKDLARALRKQGVKKPYLIDGGYKAWTAAGLPTKGEGPLTPIKILKEETEAIVGEVKPTPDGIVLVVIGVVAGSYAVYEWEKALQLIGFLGICQVAFDRINSYRSVDDLKTDIRSLGKPFKTAVRAAVSVASRFQPSKLQLATTPSTSAVKEKVLQAAAKHGPHVSGTEERQEVESPPPQPSPTSHTADPADPTPIVEDR